MPYHAFAAYYDRLMEQVDYRRRAQYFDSVIRQHLSVAEKPILLDLACGTGSLSVELSRLGYDVIGVDGSADMLSEAASKGAGEILWLCQDFSSLDLYGTVDAAVCALDSLNHITDETALEAAIGRVALFTVRAAGGYLVQLLPGAGEDTIARLEENINAVKPVSTMIDEGMGPREIIETVLAGFFPEILDEREVRYRCTCSKQRVERALLSIGREDLEKLAEEQETTEVACHFCDKKYTFTRAELEALLRR